MHINKNMHSKPATAMLHHDIIFHSHYIIVWTSKNHVYKSAKVNQIVTLYND